MLKKTIQSEHSDFKATTFSILDKFTYVGTRMIHPGLRIVPSRILQEFLLGFKYRVQARRKQGGWAPPPQLLADQFTLS